MFFKVENLNFKMNTAMILNALLEVYRAEEVTERLSVKANISTPRLGGSFA